MQIKIFEMAPDSSEGRGATAVEAAIAQGFRLHGGPVVWRERLLQVVILDEEKDKKRG